MPKLKTKKSAAKRFKVTKRKKILRSKSKKRHLLTDKSAKKKRSLRGSTTAGKTETKRLLKLMPYA